ncbi:two-component sensor histidine kinase/CheY-like chemotaxis protein [Sphingomonas jejuensis]|uniref:histidine kinase n=1 Tax=Sphingomonas jejuensis TaxID=904715 RepID=A0ABX0XN98_9SPHN|nr:response regulator [Sphingomonas jejuensis]NJC34710.1 two-component sensor histidine kinase/CheY-like chemotaxis protein [Sphingomonas jejuensis]
MSEADPVARLLYVDDDVGLARLAQKALTRRGFEVEVAHSGAEGLARLDEARFDAVALDHYMPVQDGLATLAQLRTRADAPPVVYVTGSEEGRIAIAALKAGATDYVVKDIGESFFELLAETIEQAVRADRTQREKAAAEAALQIAHDRAQALLREVNHRVANSLALVGSFVQMQARLVDGDARAALEETQSRIAAVAQVHRRLYTSDDVGQVRLDDYLHGLVDELSRTMASAGRAVRIGLVAEPLSVPPDQAVNLGVVVNELVTNACKYAYPDGRPGEIRVAARKIADDSLRLSVEDDGVGWNGEQKPLGTGLGSRIVRAIAASMAAPLRFDQERAGTCVYLDVPLRDEG